MAQNDWLCTQKPQSLQTMLFAATHSGAHVLTSPHEKWDSLETPPEADVNTERWLPLGNAV